MGKNNNQQRRPMPKNPNPMSNPRSMAKEGIRLIRNMAFGKFNFYEEGHVFRNDTFVTSTISEIDKRINELQIHITAINIAYAYSDDDTVKGVLFRDCKTLDAWNMVRTQLCNILLSGGDTGYLFTIMNRLPEYKYYI